MNKIQKIRLTIILVAATVIIDQIVKIWVKTHLYIGEDIALIGEWCRLHFIENEGFAFGTAFGGSIGKLILTTFRLVMSGVIIWYIIKKIKENGRTSFIVCLALILAGAIGNIVDSCFYGLIFSESSYNVAVLFPPEGGYASLFLGKVVDMFYFPLFEFDWPQWIPLLGGKHFEFFNAIFNVADAAITIGVIWLIIELVLIQKKSESTSSNEKNIKTEVTEN